MKVRYINNEGLTNVTKGNIYKVLTDANTDYVILDDLKKLYCVPKSRFEVVEEESTTEKEVFKGWEIIKMCEEGKIKNGTILQDLDDEHFTVFNGVIIDGEKENFDSNHETTSSFFVRNRFRIIKKEYTFEEAFKAYEEGKEIESCYSGVTYKLQHGGSDCFGGGQKTSTIAFNEIRGKWYIND